MFFPHNLDFRGRAYPIPPNLNHMGNDFTRGVLRFAEAKRLGPRGLYWLKVQHKLSTSSGSSDCRSNSDSTAALHGADKLSFDEREAYCTEHMEQVRDSAEHPLDGNRWWAQSDDPWQCLAACMEVTAAIDSTLYDAASVITWCRCKADELSCATKLALQTFGNPEEYMSSLPIHQDGSCNGLQHYAALGRDAAGGEQYSIAVLCSPRAERILLHTFAAVNLLPGERPRDVYAGVCAEVNKKLAAIAATELGTDATPEEIKAHKYCTMLTGSVDLCAAHRTAAVASIAEAACVIRFSQLRYWQHEHRTAVGHSAHTVSISTAA
eukprot:1939-Heterococcus_DN1.PRE.1